MAININELRNEFIEANDFACSYKDNSSSILEETILFLFIEF